MRTARVLILVLSLAAFGGAQSGQSDTAAPQPPSPSSRDPQFPKASQDDELDRIQKEQLKAQNKSRHASLKKDTDRLLELATELKMQVDKSSENMLSLDVIKKAEEIEKLAHSVKEKMKGM